jgi:hypothetical protein
VVLYQREGVEDPAHREEDLLYLEEVEEEVLLHLEEGVGEEEVLDYHISNYVKCKFY